MNLTSSLCLVVTPTTTKQDGSGVAPAGAMCTVDCESCRKWHPQETELLAHFLTEHIREDATLPEGMAGCRSSMPMATPKESANTYDDHFANTMLAPDTEKDALRGAHLPATHCAFIGCDKTHTSHEELYDHLIQCHPDTFEKARVSACEFIQECVKHSTGDEAMMLNVVFCHVNPKPHEELPRLCNKVKRDLYHKAISSKQQETVPVVNHSTDRRCDENFANQTKDEDHMALMCFSCARVLPFDGTEAKPQIRYHQAFSGGKFLGTMDAQRAEELLGHATFLEKYGNVHGGVSLDPKGTELDQLRERIDESNPDTSEKDWLTEHLIDDTDAKFQGWRQNLVFEDGDVVRVLCCPEASNKPGA